MNNFLIAANWKLNGSLEMIANFLQSLKLQVSINKQKNTIIIAPPHVYLEQVYKNIKHLNFLLGAQNVDINLIGSFTGETSILMLKDIGVKYVIVGHSERRFFHHENDILIAKKFSLIKSAKLIPILCIGENEKEKTYKQTEQIIINQLSCIFNSLGKTAFRNAVIAYEPIWAIGTGFSANPDDVQSIHAFIKDYIHQYDSLVVRDLIIQYGGSINSSNTKNFLEKKDINGLLIGGSSLNVKEFIKIIEIANNIL